MVGSEEGGEGAVWERRGTSTDARVVGALGGFVHLAPWFFVTFALFGPLGTRYELDSGKVEHATKLGQILASR